MKKYTELDRKLWNAQAALRDARERGHWVAKESGPKADPEIVKCVEILRALRAEKRSQKCTT